MGKENIIQRTQELIQNRLLEREPVELACFGTFAPLLQGEYVQQDDDGTRWLMPPSVELTYTPAEYLLLSDHYTQLDFRAPQEYISSRLTSPIADLSGESESTVREVLEQAFRTLLTDLFRGRRITLLNLGDLYITEEVLGILILNFVPSESLLTTLSRPFSAFRPTKLHPQSQFDDLESRTSTPAEPLIQVAIPQYTPEPIAEPTTDPITEPKVAGPAVEVEDLPAAAPAEVPLTPHQTADSKGEKPKMTWVLWLLLFFLLMYIGFRLLRPSEPIVKPAEPDPTTIEETKEVVVKEEPEPEPEPEPELEPLGTVEIVPGSSLARISRDYYGRAQYWVYIYMTNSELIRDPNNVPIGTKLVVPALETYGITGDTQEALHEAKQWEKLILSGQYTSYEEQKDEITPLNQ